MQMQKPQQPGRSLSRGRPPLPPFVGYEDLVVACGHVVKFGLCADGKDRFREARKKKMAEKACKACRALKQQQEQEAAKMRKLNKPPATPPKPKTKLQLGRLPHGACFEMNYDSASQTWSGTLTIPKPDGKPSVVTDKASGVFRLLSKLDSQYREIEGKSEQAPASPAD
jgi:hypothetical protein